MESLVGFLKAMRILPYVIIVLGKQFVASGDISDDAVIDISSINVNGPYILLIEYTNGYREVLRLLVTK